MNTSDVIKTYLAARRAQGVQLRSGARTLRQFARETGDLPLNQVTPQAVATFLRGKGVLSAVRVADRTVSLRYGTRLRGGVTPAGAQAEVAATADTVRVLALRTATSARRHRRRKFALQSSPSHDVPYPAACAVWSRVAHQ